MTVSGSFQRGWSQREKTTDLPVSWTAYRKTVFLQTTVTDGKCILQISKGVPFGVSANYITKMSEPQTPIFPVREIYIIHPIRCRKKSIISTVRFLFQIRPKWRRYQPLNRQVRLCNRCEAGVYFLRSTAPHPKGTEGFNFIRVDALFMLTMFDT